MSHPDRTHNPLHPRTVDDDGNPLPVCPQCSGPVELTPSGSLTCQRWGRTHFRITDGGKALGQWYDAGDYTAPLLSDREAHHAGHAANVGGTHSFYDGCPNAAVRP